MSLITSNWAKFMKLVFVFNNFVFLLIGVASIGFGLWGVIQGEKVFEQEWFPKLADNDLQADLQSNVKHAFTWLIVGAVILVGIAFLGFCGGAKENRCILGVFFIILFVLTIVFVAALVLFYAFPDVVTRGLSKAIEEEKRKYLEESKTNETSRVEKNVESTQTKLKCCLWNETFAEENNITTCFENWGESASSRPANSTYHGEDCVKALLTKLKSSIKEKEMTFALIVVITICVCVVQMILSLYICCKIKSVNYENMK